MEDGCGLVERFILDGGGLQQCNLVVGRAEKSFEG